MWRRWEAGGALGNLTRQTSGQRKQRDVFDSAKGKKLKLLLKGRKKTQDEAINREIQNKRKKKTQEETMSARGEEKMSDLELEWRLKRI